MQTVIPDSAPPRGGPAPSASQASTPGFAGVGRANGPLAPAVVIFQEPEVVGVLDRLLLVFCPLGLLAIGLELPQHGRFGGSWVSGVHLTVLGIGLLTTLGRGRVAPSVRLLIYSLAFALAGGAEAFALGALGNGLLLSFLGVLLASVAHSPRIRWAVGGTAFGLLGAAAVGHAGGWLAAVADPEVYARNPWTGAGGLALFGFALVVILYRRRLGEGLERNHAQLRLAEGHFRMIFEMAGDATLLVEDGRIIEANTQAEVAFGYSVEELLRLPLAEVCPELQANGRRSLEAGRQLLDAANEAPQYFRWLYRRKDGRLFEAEVSLSSTLHDTRRIYLAIVRDLSDYRLVERENRLLATALNHAGEAVAITDAAGLIVYVNRAFEEITGYGRHEVHGKNPRLLKSGRHDTAFYQEMWATIASGRAWRGRLQNRRKDGGIYTENTCITPLRDDRGTISHYVAVKRDITRELELEDQLVQSRKMEAVGRLAGGIAHDFNNILQVITGNVALASLDAPAGHPVHGSLDEISRASGRAVHLVQQLLAFSRREELRLRPVELGALVTDTARMLRRLIGEDISLEIKAAPGLLHVMADPMRIEQVLLNLCVNARDALLDGGRITIESEITELDADYCRDHAEARPGRHVVVAVSDDGCGIPKEIQHRIFEPFFSTKEVGRGTGLGLATVYAIVRQHGGFINLYSEVGLGTTFRFYLPAAAVAGVLEDVPAAVDLATLRGQGETILVAEDDEQVLAVATRVLGQANYRVLTARDGIEALEVYTAHAGPIHLALLDVVMPRRNGRATHDELRLRDPDLPVIFATGYSYHHLQDGLIEELQVLRKPFTSLELLTQVRAALSPRCGSETGGLSAPREAGPGPALVE